MANNNANTIRTTERQAVKGISHKQIYKFV